MMEKFAEQYCIDNPDRFANADCAFVLGLMECKARKTGQTDRLSLANQSLDTDLLIQVCW